MGAGEGIAGGAAVKTGRAHYGSDPIITIEPQCTDEMLEVRVESAWSEGTGTMTDQRQPSVPSFPAASPGSCRSLRGVS